MKKQVEVFYCDDCGARMYQGFHFDFYSSFYLEKGEKYYPYIKSGSGTRPVRRDLCFDCIRELLECLEEKTMVNSKEDVQKSIEIISGKK